MADAHDLPQGRRQAGDRHLKFHENRDNLANTEATAHSGSVDGQLCKQVRRGVEYCRRPINRVGGLSRIYFIAGKVRVVDLDSPAPKIPERVEGSTELRSNHLLRRDMVSDAFHSQPLMREKRDARLSGGVIRQDMRCLRVGCYFPPCRLQQGLR